MAWALQDAKAKFSEVVKLALSEGPQEVTVRGEPTAVVISKVEFDELKAARGIKPKKNLAEFLMDGDPWPDDFVELVNRRSPDPGRDIEF